MRKFTILKPQYRQLAERPATPPPPPYEPLLSPPPAAAISGDAAHPRYHDRDDNGDSATTNASGMSSVSTDPQLPHIGGPFVASSSVKVASREALMVAIKGGSLPVHKPSARR